MSAYIPASDKSSKSSCKLSSFASLSIVPARAWSIIRFLFDLTPSYSTSESRYLDSSSKFKPDIPLYKSWTILSLASSVSTFTPASSSKDLLRIVGSTNLGSSVVCFFSFTSLLTPGSETISNIFEMFLGLVNILVSVDIGFVGLNPVMASVTISIALLTPSEALPSVTENCESKRESSEVESESSSVISSFFFWPIKVL